jgi:hypothetical protein
MTGKRERFITFFVDFASPNYAIITVYTSRKIWFTKLEVPPNFGSTNQTFKNRRHV